MNKLLLTTFLCCLTCFNCFANDFTPDSKCQDIIIVKERRTSLNRFTDTLWNKVRRVNSYQQGNVNPEDLKKYAQMAIQAGKQVGSLPKEMPEYVLQINSVRYRDVALVLCVDIIVNDDIWTFPYIAIVDDEILGFTTGENNEYFWMKTKNGNFICERGIDRQKRMKQHIEQKGTPW